MPALIPTIAALTQRYGDRMGGYDNQRSGWMIVLMVIFGVALIGAIIWGAIAVSRSGRHQPPAAPSGPSPREILDQRYARGELDTADYEERKRLLT
jgi:putative membrane protein